MDGLQTVLLQVVAVVGDHLTANVAQLALAWVHHHNVDLVVGLLHPEVLVMCVHEGLVRVHLEAVELLLLCNVDLRVGVSLLGHPDILGVGACHAWLHALLLLLYYKVAYGRSTLFMHH